MKLAAAAPKYGWTDLVDSLVPTGQHIPVCPETCPPFDGSDSTVADRHPEEDHHRGALRQRQDRHPAGSAHATFPTSIDQAFGVPSVDRPVRVQPALREHDQHARCRSSSTTAPPTTRTTSSTRSRPTRATAHRCSTRRRSPTRCSRRSRTCGWRTGSRAIVPGYPIQQYFGDYQHFVQNKAKEWGDICGADHHVCRFADYPGGNVNATPTGLVRTGATTRLDRFVDHYAQPPGNPSQPQPQFDVTASLQICPQNAVPRQPGRRARRHVHRRQLRGPHERHAPARHGRHPDHGQRRFAEHARGQRRPGRELRRQRRQVPGRDHAGGARASRPTTATRCPSPYTMLGATNSRSTTRRRARRASSSTRACTTCFPSGTAVMVDRGVRRVTESERHGHLPAARQRLAFPRRPPRADRGRPGRRPVPAGLDRLLGGDDQPRDAADPGARGARRTRGRRARLRCSARWCRRISRAPRPTASTARRSRSGRATRPSSPRASSRSARPDSNGQAANSVGLGAARREARQPLDARRRGRRADRSLDRPTCAASGDLSDYTGELLVNETWRGSRIATTAPAANEPGTMSEYDFPVFAAVPGRRGSRDRRRLLAHDDRRRDRPGCDQGGQAHDLGARSGTGVRRRRGRQPEPRSRTRLRPRRASLSRRRDGSRLTVRPGLR